MAHNKNIEARIVDVDSSESHTTGRPLQKSFRLRGNARSVMLNGGPVNKKELQGPSPEPTDDGEAFATRDRQNFMKRVGLEGDQQSGFTHQRKSRRLIVKIQRAAGE